MADGELAEGLRALLPSSVARIMGRPAVNKSYRIMRTRAEELGGRDRAMLAAVGVSEAARRRVDKAMDDYLNARTLDELPDECEELVIGGGLHAAIYAAVRYADTRTKVPVIERRDRLGGVFGLAKRPVFYLNSRNRPEDDPERPIPGTKGPLNVLMGAAVQVADITGAEYPFDTDLGFATRMNLMLYADPFTGVEAVSFDRDHNGLSVMVASNRDTMAKRVRCQRIILASGIGKPTIGPADAVDGETVMTFEQFVARMGDLDNVFPLQDWETCAVIGANDSGRAAVEYLLGQGPKPGFSVASLDYPLRIDWYGQQSANKEAFEKAERSRYSGIGRYMPRRSTPGYYFRVKPIRGKATSLDGMRVRFRTGNNSGSSKSKAYDHIVICAGYQQRVDELVRPLLSPKVALTKAVLLDGVAIARRYTGLEVYKIGPCAELPVTGKEKFDSPAFQAVPDNAVALFRYTERTAALARLFGESQELELERRPNDGRVRKVRGFTRVSDPDFVSGAGRFDGEDIPF